MDGFIENSLDFKRKAYLIDKYLKMNDDCSKEEAVTFCARACYILEEHKNEKVNFAGYSICGSQHVPIRFY